MKKILHLTVCFALLFVAACKKEPYHVPPPPVIPPNDIIETTPHVLTGITLDVNADIGGYYVGLPAHYAATTKVYPVILFFHGAGQYGNGAVDLPSVLNDGIAQVLDSKRFPPDVLSNGKHFSFVVLAPQFRREPTDDELASFLHFARTTYRLDSSRIYVSGFSHGGVFAADFGCFHANELAALVPIAGASTYNVTEKTKYVADARLPVWCLHNSDDEQISPDVSKAFVDSINSFHPLVPARLTLLPDFGILNHDAWTKATDPDYRENGMNIYEWMLQYKR